MEESDESKEERLKEQELSKRQEILELNDPYNAYTNQPQKQSKSSTKSVKEFEISDDDPPPEGEIKQIITSEGKIKEIIVPLIPTYSKSESSVDIYKHLEKFGPGEQFRTRKVEYIEKERKWDIKKGIFIVVALIVIIILALLTMGTIFLSLFFILPKYGLRIRRYIRGRIPIDDFLDILTEYDKNVESLARKYDAKDKNEFVYARKTMKDYDSKKKVIERDIIELNKETHDKMTEYFMKNFVNISLNTDETAAKKQFKDINYIILYYNDINIDERLNQVGFTYKKMKNPIIKSNGIYTIDKNIITYNKKILS